MSRIPGQIWKAFLMAGTDGAHSDDLRIVLLPSGAGFSIYEREVAYFEGRVHRYLADNKLTNASDFATLDQVLVLELLFWRYGNWASQQKDYWDEPIDEAGMVKLIKETSTELRQMKASLGIDKISRDKQRGEDSVAVYLENLRSRAKEFGVMREEQLTKGLTLIHEILAKATLYVNCTPDEREELKIQADDILQWINTDVRQSFDEIDAHFRENSQKFWIREM
jgi:hypothetical protein